ncbi:MAG: dihydroneopterin aldolase [Clostridia bacterium]|jgi:dihydroneopterin aldolase|nr:dihydroneopterin aldolase [Clostridia bacterium]
MDKIIVKGLKVFAYHGVNPEEKINGQNFILDITAYIDLTKPCITDKLSDTVSYAKIIKSAKMIFTEQKDDLIERAAMRVADGLFKEFQKLRSVTVCVKKPEAPIDADFEYTAVEITVGK